MLLWALGNCDGLVIVRLTIVKICLQSKYLFFINEEITITDVKQEDWALNYNLKQYH